MDENNETNLVSCTSHVDIARHVYIVTPVVDLLGMCRSQWSIFRPEADVAVCMHVQRTEPNMTVVRSIVLFKENTVPDRKTLRPYVDVGRP